LLIEYCTFNQLVWFLLSTFEARFDLTPEVSELLAQNASHWSWGLHKAWSLQYRQGLNERSAYAELCKFGFTSKQVGSILIAVDMRYKAIKELKEYEFKNLELAIEKRTQAISTKNRKIESLTKRVSKLRTQRNKLAPKNVKERSAKYRAVLASIRDAESDLQFCKNWVDQKSRALHIKKGKLATLAKVIESGRFSLCFGSSSYSLNDQFCTMQIQHRLNPSSLGKWRGMMPVKADGGLLVQLINHVAIQKSNGCLKLSNCGYV